MYILLFFLTIIIGVPILGTFINILSSPDTKIFRKYWISQVAVQCNIGDIIDNSQRSKKAKINLLDHFNIPHSNGQVEWDNTEIKANISKMLNAAHNFDIKHPHNKGVLVTKSLERSIYYSTK